MSPEPQILSETDLTTSKSEKPAGETTTVLDVKIPKLISRLSFLRTYVFEALSKNKCKRLSTQTTRITKLVQNNTTENWRPGAILCTTPNPNPSQKMKTATIAIKTVLATTPGTIHGLPIQSTEPEFTEEPCDNSP
jgi:hypothetical protein